jgi:hypothetical protein
MSAGPGAAGLAWLWAMVADHAHGNGPECLPCPAPGRDHDLGPQRAVSR